MQKPETGRCNSCIRKKTICEYPDADCKDFEGPYARGKLPIGLTTPVATHPSFRGVDYDTYLVNKRAFAWEESGGNSLAVDSSPIDSFRPATPPLESSSLPRFNSSLPKTPLKMKPVKTGSAPRRTKLKAGTSGDKVQRRPKQSAITTNGPPPAYSMERGLGTVQEAYREWYQGLEGRPSVIHMETTYGNAWRTRNTDVKFFQNRRRLIEEVDRLKAEHGEEVAIAMMDERRQKLLVAEITASKNKNPKNKKAVTGLNKLEKCIDDEARAKGAALMSVDNKKGKGGDDPVDHGWEDEEEEEEE